MAVQTELLNRISCPPGVPEKLFRFSCILDIFISSFCLSQHLEISFNARRNETTPPIRISGPEIARYTRFLPSVALCSQLRTIAICTTASTLWLSRINGSSFCVYIQRSCNMDHL